MRPASADPCPRCGREAPVYRFKLDPMFIEKVRDVVGPSG
jgi:hypothetical protein